MAKGIIKVISFTGAQGTGKTTMRTLLVNKLLSNGCSIINNYVGVKESISRDAAGEGFPINLEATFESQYYMTCKYIEADLMTRKRAEHLNVDYVIVDRSIFDVLPYSKLCSRLSILEYKIIEDMVLNHLQLYKVDSLIYCEPLDIIVRDENRSDDKEYQAKVDDIIKSKLYDLENVPKMYFNKLYILHKDSPIERLRYLIKEIPELSNV
jgi:thymidylate kinase